VALVVANAEFFLDDSGDAGAGPDLAAEAVGLRPVPEELRVTKVTARVTKVTATKIARLGYSGKKP